MPEINWAISKPALIIRAKESVRAAYLHATSLRNKKISISKKSKIFPNASQKIPDL